MKISLEYKIRLQVLAIYLTVALLFAGAIFYLTPRNESEEQKNNLKQTSHLLTSIKELITSIDNAQTNANHYISSKQKGYLNQFLQENQQIKVKIDSITSIPATPRQIKLLLEIKTLLSLQSKELKRVPTIQEDPLIQIRERLDYYRKEIKPDSVRITTTTEQQKLPPAKRKGFFKRLADVFKETPTDTVVQVKQRTETITIENRDQNRLIQEIDTAALASHEHYTSRIKSLEQQTAQLIETNQRLHSQISTLLVELYSESLNSNLEAIHQSESALHQDYRRLIIGGLITLSLLFILVWLIIRDVNQGKRARLKLEEANQRIQDIMESRHRLLLSVSHDIKSPLSTILGYIENEEAQGHPAISARNASKHILSLLENLLEYAGLEQGKVKLYQRTFSPEELGIEVCSLFEQTAEKKGLVLDLNTDNLPSPLLLYGDEVKIRQIAINLVSNALKYTIEGGVALEMNYRNDALRLVVIDTGTGISPDQQKELFQPFKRMDSNHTLAQGSGLGMYVIAGLVDAMGGTIRVESEVGKGSRFEVTIPCPYITSCATPIAKRIAVYDDDSSILQLAQQYLTQLGHHVHLHNKLEKPNDCEVVLTDLEMGSFSGLDILAASEALPVVIMTGRSDFDLTKAKELGFVDFLPKPFSVDSLQRIFGKAAAHGASLLPQDEEEMKEIIHLFKEDSQKNCALLQKAIEESDFENARKICHRMIGMTAQLNYEEIVLLLRQVDAHREGAYDQWQQDIGTLIHKIEQTILG